MAPEGALRHVHPLRSKLLVLLMMVLVIQKKMLMLTFCINSTRA